MFELNNGAARRIAGSFSGLLLGGSLVAVGRLVRLVSVQNVEVGPVAGAVPARLGALITDRSCFVALCREHTTYQLGCSHCIMITIEYSISMKKFHESNTNKKTKKNKKLERRAPLFFSPGRSGSPWRASRSTPSSTALFVVWGGFFSTHATGKTDSYSDQNRSCVLLGRLCSACVL